MTAKSCNFSWQRMKMQQHLSARNNIFYVYFFNITRVYSSSLLCSIVGRNRLPFFKIYSNFVHFCPNSQMFCPFFNISVLFFWKITPTPLLFRMGPAQIIFTEKKESKKDFAVDLHWTWHDFLKIKRLGGNICSGEMWCSYSLFVNFSR